MLVRYDVRGTGFSDREFYDHSLEAQMMDLEAGTTSIGRKNTLENGLAQNILSRAHGRWRQKASRQSEQDTRNLSGVLESKRPAQTFSGG